MMSYVALCYDDASQLFILRRVVNNLLVLFFIPLFLT